MSAPITLTVTYTKQVGDQTITATASGPAQYSTAIDAFAQDAVSQATARAERIASYRSRIDSVGRAYANPAQKRDAIERTDAAHWEHEPVCNIDQEERVA